MCYMFLIVILQMPYGAFGNPMMMPTQGYGNFGFNAQSPSLQSANASATIPNAPPPPNPPAVTSASSTTVQPPSLVARPSEQSGSAPEGSSTPKHVPLPHFSPITPPSVNDRSKCTTVVMGDMSLASSAGSVYSSQEKDMTQSSLYGLTTTVVDQKEPGSQVPDDQKVIDNVTPQSNTDTASLDTNNNQDNNVNSVENSDQDTSAKKELPTYPQNMERQPLLSNNRRITLAYKYVPFEKQVVSSNKPVSEARASDDDLSGSAIASSSAKPEDVLESSFPVSGYITKSWKYRDTKFRESLKKGLSMSEKPAKEQAGEDEDDDGFTLYSANFASILKNKPDKKPSDFHYHKAKFATFVELDHDINKLRRDDTKEWEMRMKLSAAEIKNIQAAQAYTLMAQSHVSAYIRASRAALNQILLTLNPDEHSENIQRIHDIKQFFEGLVLCKEQTVTDAVYVHAGLQAQLRSDFLKAQGTYLPLHTKQALLHESLGGNALFDHQISKYEAEITAHNAKLHQNRMDSAVINSIDKYKIPKKTASVIPPLQPVNSGFDNRGRGQTKFQDGYHDNKGSRNQNKGRGNQNKGNQQNHTRGRGRGGGGGGGANRGKKPKN